MLNQKPKTMKKVLLIGLAFVIGLAVVAQKPQVKQGIPVRNLQKEQPVTFEPIEKVSSQVVTPKHNGLKNADIVTILDLGTSANVLGYSSGSRTMVWADPDLNAVINFHRAGPGSTPPSLSGYYAMDLGLNKGASQADWTNQIIVSSAKMVASPYYYDASRYPSAGIYNPAGNTTLANAYLAFFGPNFCNLVVSGFGGYTYGAANLVNHTDTARTLRWYAPTPYTYIPDGFTIGSNGVAHMLDGDNNVESGSVVYQDSTIYGRGVWNATKKQFDYTFTTFASKCRDMASQADCKIAASPDGTILYMSVLTNWVGGTIGTNPLIDSTYYPLIRKSTDGGLTWSDPKPVYLDGANGIAAVKNAYSDYFIENFFVGPPFPTRDEIPYTTAFDHNISVDRWGNPHIAVAIGYAPGGYSISTGVDSLINVFDLYCEDWINNTWYGVKLGSLKTFRGTWATYTSDNRVYISRDKEGTHMFVTWNDTHVDGETNNQNPDVWARGFNLLTNKITSDAGLDAPVNVTFLSDITQEAYWQCTSPICFTETDKWILPIATQWFADAAADSKFKYIPDFSFVSGDFTISVNNPPLWTGTAVAEKKDVATFSVYPNPVKDMAKVNLTLNQNANVTIDVTNLVGQQVISFNKGQMTAGTSQFNFDASQLTAGVYFVTVNADGQKFTQKIIVR